MEKHSFRSVPARLALLALAMLGAALLSLCLGAAAVSPREILSVLSGGGKGTTAASILLYVRLPRTLGCLLAGAALAVSGAVIQTVLANPLAAPNIIGVNSGAGLGVALCCAVLPTAAAAVPFAAFLGAFAGVMLVLLISEKAGASRMTLVLAGVAISGMFGAGIDAVLTVFPDSLIGYSDFRIGGLANLSMGKVAPAAWVILLCLGAALALANEMDVLALGADTARSLGLRVRGVRVALLALAAAVEQGSSHPLAQAIVREAQRRQLSIPLASGQRALAGSGIEAEVNGSRILICAASKAAPAEHEAQIQQLESAGQTVVLVMRGETLLGILALRDTLRDDARQAVDALHQLGVQGVILTGDNPRAAAAIASELGLEFRAGLLPADKVNAVIALNADAPLAMVGDGINDAPAMKAATIGIAMGSGTDVALETADAALTHNRLTGLAQMISLARATHANIRQNIAIALGLKGIFLVTTLLGLTGLWLAVLADTGATVLVTANALRLLRKKL